MKLRLHQLCGGGKGCGDGDGECRGLTFPRDTAVLSHNPDWSLDAMTLRGHFSLANSKVQRPPKLYKVSTLGSLSGYLDKVIHLVMLFCLFPIIPPIREPMLTQRQSLMVFVGLTVYFASAVGYESLLPLSRDKAQTGGAALTRWWGDRGGVWLLRTGQSGKILDLLGHM